jgi:hypothetical protein
MTRTKTDSGIDAGENIPEPPVGAVMFDTPDEAIAIRRDAARTRIITPGQPRCASDLVFAAG